MKKVILLLVLLNTVSYASVDPAELLLSSYRSQCPNVVSFTAGAQSLLSTFRGVVTKLSERESCYGINSGLTSLANFEKSYTNYEIYRDYQLDKEQKEKLIADYTYFLAQNQLSLNPSEIEFIQNEIFHSQASIVSLDSDIVRFEHMGQGYEQGAGSFASSFNDLLGSINDSNNCMEKSSSMYGSLLGSGLSIASLFSSPANSLYLATAGSVSRSMSTFLNDVKYTKIANDSDSILWPEAIRCTSEAMAVNYCSAVRTKNLFAKYLDEQSENSTLFEGVDLLNYHMKGLDEWLVQVFAGSPIISQGDLTDRDKPIAQYELLGRIIRYLQAYKRIKDEEFKTISDDVVSINNAVYGTMVGMSYIMTNPGTLAPGTTEGGCHAESCYSSVQNPIFNSRTNTLLLFQLFGMSEIPKECKGASGDYVVCPSFKEYIETKDIKVTLQNWDNAYANAQKIVSDTLNQVNIQRARTISFDPIGLFVQARRRYNNKPNAIEGLKEIYKNGMRIRNYLIEIGCNDEPEFCENSKPTWMNSYSLQIEDIEETLKVTSVILDLVQESANPRPLSEVDLPEVCRKSSVNNSKLEINISDERKEKAFALSTCITEVLQLAERGNDIYFSKVRNMVSMELEIKLAHGDFNSQMSDVLMATRDDLVERLTKTYGNSSTASIGQIITGLDSSQDITEETMNLFFKVFSKKITKVFSDGKMSARVKDEMCFRVLPFLNNSKDSRKFIHKIYDDCKNVTMQEYKKGPSITWSNYVSKDRGNGKFFPYNVSSNTDELMCVLDDFFLKNRLYREKLKGPSRRR